jgi:pimeloyl-ACP methyl ester carboxylesterase
MLRSLPTRRQLLLAIAALPFATAMSAEDRRETLVLVHGLWMTGLESNLLRGRLQDDYGFDTRQYSYHTVEVGLEDNVRLLAEFLADVPGDTLHVVGHSLGGLLALHTLMRHPDRRPGRIVCLGSPLKGSVAARAMAGLPFGEELLGATIREAVLNGGLDAYRGEREVGVIAGTLAVGLGVVIENLPRPNDGTIAVEETKLPGIKDHLEVPVSHTGLLVSEVVASQTAYFLRHGQFARVP